jgi:hypothetical protein
LVGSVPVGDSLTVDNIMVSLSPLKSRLDLLLLVLRFSIPLVHTLEIDFHVVTHQHHDEDKDHNRNDDGVDSCICAQKQKQVDQQSGSVLNQNEDLLLGELRSFDHKPEQHEKGLQN